MPEPGLQEILNIGADPERGTGTPAVVFNSKDLVDNLAQANRFKAEQDWNKYNLFLSTLKEQYKDLNEIMKQPVMTKDKPLLQQKAAEIFKGIAADPKSFFSGPKYEETMARIAELQGLTTESKQNGIFDFANRQWIAQNPEHWYNEDNRKMLDDYVNQPLGSRNPYMLQLRGMYDPNAMATLVANAAKEETPFSEMLYNNQFIQTGKRIKYDPNKIEQMAESVWNTGRDAMGTPYSTTFQKLYDSSPDLKAQYKTAKDAFIADLKSRVPSDSETRDEAKPNPGYLKAEDIAAEIKKANIQASAGITEQRLRFLEGLRSSGYSLIDEKKDWYNPKNWDFDADAYNAKVEAQTGKKSSATKEDYNKAVEFGNSLFKELQGISSGAVVTEDGKRKLVITPKGIRKLNSEKLRYLGNEVLSSNKDGEQVGSGLKPLTFTNDELEKGQVALLLDPETKEITVYKGVDAEQLNADNLSKPGTKFGGIFDPTRSTNLRQIITNRLNDENTKSGAGERNAYAPIDAGGLTVGQYGPWVEQNGVRYDWDVSKQQYIKK